MNIGLNLFMKFVKEIRNENRFFIDPVYLELFDIIIEQNVVPIESSELFYRGRINKRFETVSYTCEELGMPTPEIATTHGRSNPLGINYLYLADNPETVVAELRPNLDDLVTVGMFILSNNKRVVRLNNFSSIGGSTESKWDSQVVSTFMAYLSRSFSRSVDVNNRELEYLPSQYFAEYCKKKQIEGVMYLSSMMDNTKSENYNYAFFSDSDFKCKSFDIYNVESVHYKSKKIN